jgi:Acyl-protein synthetase, LuxE
MNKELSSFAVRLCERFFARDDVRSFHSTGRKNEPPHVGSCQDFNTLALELFALQFKYNAAYRRICEGRDLTPGVIEDWTQIPAVPTTAFKEMALSCLPPDERIAVFHSSGTTEQKPSRHFHGAESLRLYEASLLPWFLDNVPSDFRFPISDFRLICLTPSPSQAPLSSLVHMLETVRSRACESAERSFIGTVAADGSWVLDFEAMLAVLHSSLVTRHPSLLLGTAFSFVHLLDFLVGNKLSFRLPPESRVMETGGYKNRSRTMPKEELHALITERLGIPAENIICEYGMSELCSQAYDSIIHPRIFRFPPWARVQIVSPETGREVADGETGLVRVFDLANVFSVMALQTEDLGVRRGDGFELIGRAQFVEPRGCSLMMWEGSASSLP